jgi:hypothetical protein
LSEGKSKRSIVGYISFNSLADANQHRVFQSVHFVTSYEGKRFNSPNDLTAPMDGEKLRYCGDKPCLEAGIYTAKLNVQGFPF